MALKFVKYHGTGNDFILLDGVGQNVDLPIEQIRQLCDRHFGVGSDGLIIIRAHSDLDFHMVFHNPDGSQSFCGNGSRCAVAFANELGLISGNQTSFLSTDGIHQATILNNGLIRLGMTDVNSIELVGSDLLLNTGSPHYIQHHQSLEGLDVVSEARKIRYSERFKTEGVNVNFVTFQDDGLTMRTYERGVEGETLSCGTGVTAAAIAWHYQQEKGNGKFDVAVETMGGKLSVLFESNDGHYTNVLLQGPAARVFDGLLQAQ